MATLLRRLRARIKYWNNAEELKKELDAHRELAAASFAASGDSERESRWKAARLLGNTTIAREDAREIWVARWIEQLLQDTRYALRTMRREWGFALTASITLAVGLGVLVGVFTVFKAIFLQPLPVRAPNEVFGVSASLTDPKPTDGFTGPAKRISYVAWDRLRKAMTTADLSVEYDYLGSLKNQPAERGSSGVFALVDETFLQNIGVGLQAGTLPAGGGVPAVAISDSVWRNRFGRDPGVIGRSLWIDTHPVVIAGVIEPRFRGFTPRVYDGFLVLNAETTTWLDKGLTIGADLLVNPKTCCVQMYGRLRRGATRTQAADELDTRVNEVHAQLGLPPLGITTWATTMAGRPSGVKSSVPALFVLLFTACAIVTLLACANIGNLQLARGLRRSGELAVRLSLGANRGRIVRQLMTESLALGLAGAFGGLLIAWTVPAAIMSLDGETALDYKPDGMVVAFALLATIVATLASGLAPAFRVTRIKWRAAGAQVVAGAGALRGLLLGVQIALSFSLIGGAALLSRGALRAAGGAEAGFEFRDIVAYSIGFPASDASAAQKAARAELTTQLAADPTLAAVDDAPWRSHMATSRLTVPGMTRSLDASWFGMNEAAASLLRIPVTAGRWPNKDPQLGETVISRSVARALWGREDVLGQTFTATHPFLKTAEFTVVGLMEEVRLSGTSAMPAVITALRADYLPTILGPAVLESKIKTVATRADSSARIRSRPLLANLREQMQGAYVAVSIASGLGFLALLLASFGVFGVFAYVVEERRREIGVRLALGANRAQIRRSIFATVSRPVVGGLAAGLLLAVAGGFALRGNLYGLSILDPLSYLTVAAVLLGAAAVATFIPLRRATRVDPAVTLRAD